VDDRQACAKLFSILLPTEACEMEFGKSEFVRGGSLLGLILLAGLGDTSLAQQTAPPLPANVPALPADRSGGGWNGKQEYRWEQVRK
jgi:hypothetical protein